MFTTYDILISKDYSGKYRKLLTAFRNDENYELRLKILLMEIPPT
jgi:hypothetical protein